MKIGDIHSECGAIPILVIVVIAVITALGGGFLAYMATHAISSILFGVAAAIIFFLVILPNLSTIRCYCLKVISQFKKLRKGAAGDENRECHT